MDVPPRRRGGAWIALVSLFSSLLVSLGASPLAAQASPAAASAPAAPVALVAPPIQLWDPGLIITDANFYNGGAMTAAEIQAFLNARIGACQSDRCLNVISVDVANRAREVSNVTGQVVCEAISGGRMSAAELIYRAQVACGISAKVILVTLQKEQGLVTSRAPSDWALRAAMGMACPDTAPCDTAFAGLATQIVAGTRQLKAYKANAFARQPGVHAIGWHPNSACGATNVNVRNYATAALYNYTPYQPNAAALANLYGTGDGCSSYGNRNFWRFYWDWFGNPQEKNGPEYIADAYAAQGGPTGPLGASRGEAVYVSNGWMREFAGGNIYWSASTGARIVAGDMLSRFLAQGGPSGWLGWPYGAETSATSNGVTGTWQWFQGATMYASPGAGAHVIVGSMREYFASTGGLAGPLGWPTGDETSLPASGGSVQAFRGGSVYRSTAGGFRVVAGDLLVAFQAAEGPSGSWGWPTGDATPATAGGVAGLWQWFQGGTAYSTPSGGAHLVAGTARTLFGALGGLSGSLGWPTSDPVAVAGNGGGTVQRFRGGAIFVSNARGTQAVLGGLLDHYESRGGPEGELGWPTGLPICEPDGSCTQPFEYGTVRWSPEGGEVGDPGPGAYPVVGAIGALYRDLGGSGGVLGLPTSNATYVSSNGGGHVQSFQGGSIYQRTGAVPYVVAGAMLETYRTTGGPNGALGWPTGAPTEATSNGVPGRWQWFQGATMYWSAGTGARALGGTIRAAFAAAGGLSGPLGWPNGEERTEAANGGGTFQMFVGGTVYRSAGGARVVSGGILAAYRAAGGPAGSWGWPTGDATAATSNGVPGTWQWFQRTTAYEGRDTDAVAVSDAIKAAFAAAGGLSGRLGWPVSAETASASNGGGSSQTFQGGAIYRSVFGAHVVDGTFLTAYQAAGGANGPWGWPAGAPTAIVAGGLSGRWQWFQNVTLYSTASTGTHAVGGATKSLFASLGGLSGTLGWPTGAAGVQAVNGGGTTQTFQGGVIYDSPAGAYRVLGAFATKYTAVNGPGGVLGWPAGPEVAWSAAGVAGAYQNFQLGIVYSSVHGTHIVSGAIRTAYGVAGGSPGPLGWPTADALSVPANGGGLAQSFQGGAVYQPGGAAAYPVSGEAFARYQTLGGPGGSIGWPIGAPTAWAASGVSGYYQYFQTATMYSSPLGVRFVSGDIRTTYSALGGSTGPLGWPRGDVSCSGGSCTQSFQGGDVRTFGSPAYAVGGPMLTAYLAAGGATGSLGAPGGNAVALTANGMSGTWQYFSGSAVIMYWTPASGAHHISGGIRTYFSALGGLVGSGLGWPTGGQQCSGDVCRQPFQGGTIVWDPVQGGRVE